MNPNLPKDIIRVMRLRRRLKSRKPEFRHFEAHKKLRLKDLGWRRPRGRHNKWRERYGGKWSGRILPNPGFSSPKAVRGLHPSGYEEVLVHTPKDLDGVNPEIQAVRIASTVGLRKRLAIEEKARELGIKVLNPYSKGD